jgi:sortase B
MMKRILNHIFVILFIVGALTSAYLVLDTYVVSALTYDELQEQVSFSSSEGSEPAVAESAKEEVNEETSANKTSNTQSTVKLNVDWEALQGVADLCGWIYIPDTKISYPVMQSSDNEDYLHHSYDGTASKAGSIFVDKLNAGFANRHVVVYGHNMADGSMFHGLKNYLDQEYAAANETVYIATPDGVTEVYTVYSVAVVDISNLSWNPYQLSFSSEDEYRGWIEDSIESSIYNASSNPINNEKVITLSTCMSRGNSGERVVVSAFKAN